jgi:hypothetical protein
VLHHLQNIPRPAVAAAPASVAVSTLAALAATPTTTTTATAFLSMSLLKHTATGLVCASLAGIAVYHLSRTASGPVSATNPAAPSSTPTASVTPALTPTPAPDPRLAQLTAENEDIRARLAAAQTAQTTAREKLAELRRPMTLDVISSTLRATARPGETVVTGGSLMPDGKRLYLLATPKREWSDGREIITIEGQYLATTDAAARSVGLDALNTNAANTLQHGQIWAAGESTATLSTLAKVGGADVLSAPRIALLPGTEGSITIGDKLLLQTTPTLAADGQGVTLELRFEASPEPAPAP